MTTTIAVNAYYSPTNRQPWAVEFRAEFPTTDERNAFIATFPKSANLVPSYCMTAFNVASGEYDRVVYSAHGRAALMSNGRNGGRNETGVARYRRTVAKAEALGYTVSWVTYGSSNAYGSREEFEAAIEVRS